MTVLAGYRASINFSTGVSTPFTNMSMTDAGDHKTFTASVAAQRYLDPAVTPTVQAALDEMQQISITGSPTGGTFTLTFGGQTTSAIAYNASASTVQAALQALSSIGSGNCSVTGGPGPATPYVVEFTGTLAHASQALITATPSLTGGTSPGITIVELQAGAALGVVTSGFTVQYCGGVILFTYGGASSVQINAGNYLVYSQAGNAFSVDIQTTVNKLDNTTFASAQANNGYITQQAGLGGHTWKLSNWHIDNFFFSQLRNIVLISAFTGANANQRLEGYGYITNEDIKIDVKALNQEDITVDGTGGIYWIAS